MTNHIKSLFTNQKPSRRSAFAVEHGTYVGEFFVFIERVKDNYYFLSLPKMEVREILVKEFEKGQKDQVIKFAERLPKEIYKVCYNQYKALLKQIHVKKSNTGHQQPSVPVLPHQPS